MIYGLRRYPRFEYEQWPKIDPTAYDPASGRVAKNAGVKYVVITSKHHDGFCRYSSTQAT